jgi:hypothetical protein
MRMAFSSQRSIRAALPGRESTGVCDWREGPNLAYGMCQRQDPCDRCLWRVRLCTLVLESLGTGLLAELGQSRLLMRGLLAGMG